MKKLLLILAVLFLINSCTQSNYTCGKTHYFYGGKFYTIPPNVHSTIEILERQYCDTIPDGQCIINGEIIDSCNMLNDPRLMGGIAIYNYSLKQRFVNGLKSEINSFYFYKEVPAGRMQITFYGYFSRDSSDTFLLYSKEKVKFRVILRCVTASIE